MNDPSDNVPKPIVEALCTDPQVENAAASPAARKCFGADCLKTHNKIFTMLVKDNLVVKLPRGRVDVLVGAVWANGSTPATGDR